jgi:hypothetical protein
LHCQKSVWWSHLFRVHSARRYVIKRCMILKYACSGMSRDPTFLCFRQVST